MSVSKTCGVIKLYSVEEIELAYTPEQVESIQRKNLDIEVMDFPK